MKWLVIKMMSRLNKRFFSLFYLFYFLFYAVSPLSYAHTGKLGDIETNVGHKAFVIAQDIHLFVLELAYKEIVLDQASSNPNSPFKILLRKKRAIIPDNTITKADTPKDSVLIAESNISPPPYRVSSLSLACDLPKPVKCFLSLHSGLSPPFSS